MKIRELRLSAPLKKLIKKEEGLEAAAPVLSLAPIPSLKCWRTGFCLPGIFYIKKASFSIN